MATVIERPRDRVVEDRTVYASDNSAGWAVAIIALLVLAGLALFVWPGFAHRATAPVSPSTIQLNVPQVSNPVVPSTPAPVTNTAPATNDTGPTGANAQ